MTTATQEKQPDRKIAVASGNIKNGIITIGNGAATVSWQVIK